MGALFGRRMGRRPKLGTSRKVKRNGVIWEDEE
jgi:hypothetical protein